MPSNEPTRHPLHLRSRLRPAPFCALVWLAWSAGCAAPVKVVSECPEPSPVEARDLSDWLMEEPPRPAQDWAARVIGQLYPEDLEVERGERDDPMRGGWMTAPWWFGKEE